MAPFMILMFLGMGYLLFRDGEKDRLATPSAPPRKGQPWWHILGGLVGSGLLVMGLVTVRDWSAVVGGPGYAWTLLLVVTLLWGLVVEWAEKRWPEVPTHLWAAPPDPTPSHCLPSWLLRLTELFCQHPVETCIDHAVRPNNPQYRFPRCRVQERMRKALR